MVDPKEQVFRDILFDRIALGQWHTKDFNKVLIAFCDLDSKPSDTTCFLAKVAGVYWLLFSDALQIGDLTPSPVRSFYSSLNGCKSNKGSWDLEQLLSYQDLPIELGFYLTNILGRSSEPAQNYISRLTVTQRAVFDELLNISSIRVD